MTVLEADLTWTGERFEPGLRNGGHDGPDRGMRYLEWTTDADPDDNTYEVDYAFLLRDGTSVTPVHDRHVEGLFPRETWVRVLRSAGYQVDPLVRPIGGGHTDEIFLCRRN